MTLIQSLDRIHALLEGDTDTPQSGEDYDLRVQLVNDATEEWGSQADTRWNELYATDTDNVGDGITKRFSLKPNFDHLNGPVILFDQAHNAYTPVGTTTVAKSSQFLNSQYLTCWVEGRELVFNQAPQSGVLLHIPYYKHPDPLTLNTDTLPMSKPRYVVHYVVARLVEQSGDYTRYNTNMQKAEDLLKQMKIQNSSLGEGVADTVQSLTPGFGI